MPYKPKLPYKLELPDDILQIIKEYAMPITRPDWRNLHIMPQDDYHYLLLHHILLYSVITNKCYIKIKKIRFWIEPKYNYRRRVLPFLEPM
jgi:hypothetical protein